MSSIIPNKLEYAEFDYSIKKRNLKKEIIKILSEDKNFLDRMRILLKRRYINLISNIILEFNINYKSDPDYLEDSNNLNIRSILTATKRFSKTLSNDNKLMENIDESVKSLFLKTKLNKINPQFHTESYFNGLKQMGKIEDIDNNKIKDPQKNILYARHLLLEVLSTMDLCKRNKTPYIPVDNKIPCPSKYYKSREITE